MKKNLRCVVTCLAIVTLPMYAQKTNVPVATGSYEADWENLGAWECPEWFRDAKFGIWAHWDPQCQAEAGDWYAREMYYPGWKQDWHKNHFGNPAEYGYKELCRDWKAEDWNPDELIQLYKSAGAKYFMAMGNHHDNFDCWNSPYQEWNSVNMGPKKDIVGGWAEACKKYGLYLGVSMHASHAWTWMEPSTWYDGNLTKEEGKGKWWEGYDPQELYAQNHPHSSGWESSGSIHGQWAWGNGAAQPSEYYKQKFLNRVLQCINDYDPSMVYFDDTVLPFWGCDESIGLNILKHYYNTSEKRTKSGKAEVVVTGKILQPIHKQAMMWDVERGIPDRSQDLPWQTCTCIGDWHYERGTYDRGGYKSADHVIRMLVDIVSKNGNMLLSIPVRGSGVIDEKERAIVMGIKAWMDINGSSIYGTRPWKVYGEGPLFESANPINAQGFNEGINYSNNDVRYVERNDTVFATIMRWPSKAEFTFTALGKSSPNYAGKVKSVKLLGHGEVKFTQGFDGLSVEIPTTQPNGIAPVFSIAFDETAPKTITIQEAIDMYRQKSSELMKEASNNTGKPNKMKIEAFNKHIADAQALINADAAKQEAAVKDLHIAYTVLKETGFNPAGNPNEVGMTDFTLDYLKEKSNFAATEMGSRFGKPVNWIVENFSIPQNDATKGVKNGIDNYPGTNCLMMGKWSGEDGSTSVKMNNARIYRKVHLKKGYYYFGAIFESLYNLGASYIYVATEPIAGTSIISNAIARLPLSKCATDGKFHGINFTLDKDQDVVLVFQCNMAAGNTQQEVRVKEVKLLYSKNPESLTQTDITTEMLLQAENFSRINGQSTSSRYGTPANWTVENYNIPTGEGTRHGLDRYPGYDCLTLGVWGDKQNNNAGNIANARIFRSVHLLPGNYYFGATYEANYQLDNAYIFASNEPLDTKDIPTLSLAYDKISHAGKDNVSFRGIYFELSEEQYVMLGFQANLQEGANEQEFRASKVKLIQYGNPTAINNIMTDHISRHNTIFNLNGQQTKTPQKGINIIDSKKILIK